MHNQYSLSEKKRKKEEEKKDHFLDYLDEINYNVLGQRNGLCVSYTLEIHQL